MGLSDQIYDELQKRIVEGVYCIGDKIPSESELCENFSSSRAIIREALARLKSDGVLESRRGSGTFIAVTPDKVVRQSAKISSLADLQHCLEFRRCIEPEAAYFAALRATRAEIQSMEKALANLTAALESGKVEEKSDFAFHKSVVIASKNDFIIQSYESFSEQIITGMKLTRGMSLMTGQLRQKNVLEGHRMIYQMIIDRDPKGARDAMRDHILSGQSRLFYDINPEQK
ncbi:FadR family transcriptional regulator [Vibrio sp. S9_S30]|uniref:FadR/GntR family transcriptional regulator n=1 Tax=Vibrio sp. S9_S30 TaxID=2720226 RepID=UPI0016801284|nr:FadR/GntR family transcriptional regulator [Vibrio sp. S9_S30]MBD1557804.1 FadR family transcriptional regulator [Vibrio sp. S9_S30]